MMLVYIDSSTLIKLVTDEPGSTALRLYLGSGTTVLTSRHSLIEAERAARDAGIEVGPAFDAVVSDLAVRELDSTLAQRAAGLAPATLGALDAVHLAAAMELRGEIDAFVTYDERMADAARAHRLPVVSPA